MNTFTDRFRTTLIVCGVLVAAVGGSIKLMKVQVVDKNIYTKEAPYTYTVDQTIFATRGEIEDVTGTPIVANKLGFNVTIEKASFPSDNQKGNEVILRLAEFLLSEGYTYNDSLPVTTDAPFEYSDATENEISRLKSTIRVNVYATAENCIDKLIDDYDISEEYTPRQQRIIAGIRYEMIMRDFSLSNVFTLCKDVSKDSVSKIKEMSLELPGVEIAEDAIRTNPVVDVIPHEIGTIGPIYAEEYDELRAQGYILSDYVGKSGIEKGMESYLRGKNGTREITVANSTVISSEITEPAVPGNTIRLTINNNFQRELQKTLEDFIKFVNEDPERDEEKALSESGAIVVLDAKNNDVLGLATAPTYTLDDYIENYSEVLNREGTPLLNRATDGLYRPGSTFKTVTATAGLNEGFITPYSTFYCGESYQFYDIKVFCTGGHASIGVTEAIRVSCNIFFYELSRMLGIDNIIKYSNLYGLGTNLGLESGDTAGRIAGPQTAEELGVTWYSGELLQAAIGQSETKITPLQMAVQASTIANRGVRYQPHLVDSIYDYLGNLVDSVEPVVAQKIEPNYDYVFDPIIDGMIGASRNTPNGEFSLNNLGYDVAIKTGTPQTTSSKATNTTVIGFAPADNPIIAFSVVIENGDNSKYLVRKIIDLYNKYYGNTIS